MSKSQPQVKSELNDWYDWLINHVPKTIKDGTSRVFKTFKDKIMGFYSRVAGNQTQLKGSRSAEPEPFNPIAKYILCINQNEQEMKMKLKAEQHIKLSLYILVTQ